VSSSWYNHENVPTWNYIAVHVYGKLSILNEQELMGSLNRLVDKYESNSVNPVKVEKLSENTLRSIKGIVGFKIKIENIHSAYKLSQNRNDEDHHNIVKELQNTKDYLSMETSEIMENNRKFTKIK
jgi:transcriptional regulator